MNNYVAQLSEEKVFKDPIHKYIYVQDQLIWDLINTSEFQRLRRIRQLGTSYLTFHGAEHSRFSHSLGVYEITRKIISQFERGNYADWPKEERLVTLCAALLHDIGHGPFSHCIEEVFETDHEQWTCAIILGDTEVNELLKQVSSTFPAQVAAVIQKTYEKPIVVSLVSSQLDADRMDYLLRDAYYTGVNYGTFDLERILRVLRPHQGKIVVKESGMHAIEDYLMSRYQMYWQIYYHPVSRSSEIVLRKIFQRAKELYEQGHSFCWMIDSLEQLLSGQKMTIQHYLSLDESLVQAAFSQWQSDRDTILASLCGRFLHRKLYKYVEIEPMDEHIWHHIEQQLYEVGIHPKYCLELDYPVNLAYKVYRSDSSIWIMDSQGELADIATKSNIVQAMSGIHQGQHYLYYCREQLFPIKERLPAVLRKILQV